MKGLLLLLMLGISIKENQMTKLLDRNVLVETENGFATGVIISKNLVLTNFHVLNSGSDVVVNGNVAKVVKVDPKNDLCLLQVGTLNVSPLEMAEVKQEDEVIAVSNPLHHVGAVLHGRVMIVEDGFIFFDAHIFYGSSGGGLYNLRGQFVGLIKGIQGKEGEGRPYGFAILASTVAKFLKE